MKTYFIALFLLLFKLSVAQQGAGPVIAQRGSLVEITYVNNQFPMQCGVEHLGFFFCRKGNIYSAIDIESLVVLHDTIFRIKVIVPQVFLDGQVLSLVLGNRYNPTLCDTSVLDSAIIVSGGPFRPSFHSLELDTVARGETVNFLIEAKGMTLTKGKKIQSMGLDGVGWPYYTLPTNAVAINDSQIIGVFTLPKGIPDGRYHLSISLEAGVPPMSYIFILVLGGQPIPTIDYISPATIGRGEEKQFTVYTKGTEFTRSGGIGVSVGYEQIDNLIVVNDTIFKFSIKTSTGDGDRYLPLTVESYMEGFVFLDSAIHLVGGKPLASIDLDREYVVKRGGKVKITIRGTNTHFKTGNFNIATSNYTEIENIKVIDSVTMVIDILADDPYSLGYVYFRYTDDEVIKPIYSSKALIVMPNEKESYVSQVVPNFFYRNTTRDYTITIRNSNLTMCDEESGWSIRAYSYPNYQYAQILNQWVVNDSTLVCRIAFDSNFTDSICALSINYRSAGGYVWLESFLNMNVVNTGIVEAGQNKMLIAELYPNPVHDNLYIDTKYPVRACTIVDITGKQTVVDPNEFKQDNTHIMVPIDKLGLRKGIYFIRLDSDNGFDYKKFVVE